jgi:hypothetical protein
VDYERGGAQKEHYDEEEVVKRNGSLCNGSGYSEIYKERLICAGYAGRLV